MHKDLAQIKTSLGFTLIELIIAIVIVVILTTIGVASFNSASQANAIQQQAQEIKSLARKLRTDASAAVKPSGCTDGSYYGTYLNFQSDGTSIKYGTSCWHPTLGTDESPSYSSLPLKQSMLIRSINAVTSGVNSTIFYNFDGKVFIFNCSPTNDCDTGTNPYIAPTQTAIQNAIDTNLEITSVQNIVITDGTSSRDYQINFSPTGLVCEEKPGANVCAN